MIMASCDNTAPHGPHTHGESRFEGELLAWNECPGVEPEPGTIKIRISVELPADVTIHPQDKVVQLETWVATPVNAKFLPDLLTRQLRRAADDMAIRVRDELPHP